MTIAAPRVAVTITLTAAYAAYARVLARSLAEHAPALTLVAAMAERRAAMPDGSTAGFTAHSIEDLGLANLPQQAFAHSPMALTVLAKPLVLRRLLDEGWEAALFLDVDVLVTGDLTPLVATCAAHAVTLTPHRLHPAPGAGGAAEELALLRAGTFNGGCLGVSRHPDGRRFLDWWQARLAECNRLDPAAGQHYDQRWLDLVPGFVDDVGIVRDPGCNVAYWNLRERRPHRDASGGLCVDGGPLRFFHFSGFNPARPATLSKHTTEITRADMGTAADLLDDYAARLHSAGPDEDAGHPYSFGCFDNGVAIPDVARELFRDMPSRARFGNPFETESPGSFYRWLTSPDERLGRDHSVSVLWGEIHRRRADLQRAFPDPADRDQEAFLAWTVRSGLDEHRLDPRLLPIGRRAS